MLDAPSVGKKVSAGPVCVDADIAAIAGHAASAAYGNAYEDANAER
jgi:hypothetical protein